MPINAKPKEISGVLGLFKARASAASLTKNRSTAVGVSHLVLDSPHSGTHYPADFEFACLLPLLRQAEDTHVEKLFDFYPEVGAAWVEAHFPRSYLDANRSLADIDPLLLDEPWPDYLSASAAQEKSVKVSLGKGLAWRLLDTGEPIYARRLSVAELQRRIDTCWQPYHAAIAAAVKAAFDAHGFCIHINCHSMPAVASSHATEFPGLAHADFVVGDRDGSSAASALSQLVCAHVRDAGFSAEYNHPYKGVEIVRRHSNPARHCHSIQLEINRRLYMDEQTLALSPGFEAVKTVLRTLLQRLKELDLAALQALENAST